MERNDAVIVQGAPFGSPIQSFAVMGNVWFVDASGRDYLAYGRDSWTPLATIGEAVERAQPGDLILLAPGEYDEVVVVPATKQNITIMAIGGRGSAFLAPSTENATALTNHGDDFTLVNVGCEGDGTGYGMLNTGKRFRASQCKFEGGAAAVKLSLGTVLQIAAGTHGKGDDALLTDCEYCWSDVGLLIGNSDYGGLTQAKLTSGQFHNCTKHVDEVSENGGSAAVTFFNLLIKDIVFRRNEDGSEPTAYIELNANNANAGEVVGCRFPTALNGGKNLVSTKLFWVGNSHPAGGSTGQPS